MSNYLLFFFFLMVDIGLFFMYFGIHKDRTIPKDSKQVILGALIVITLGLLIAVFQL